MSWGIAIGAGLGVLNSLSQSKADAKRVEQIDAANMANIMASAAMFRANNDVIIINRAKNRESAANAILESARSSAANIREAVGQMEQQASTVTQRDEGITAGVSAARQLSTFYTQASKELGAMEEAAVASITNIADTLQEADNQLVNQSRQNFNSLVSSIASGVQTAQTSSNPIGAISNIVSGIGTGMSLQKGFNNLMATNTATN